MHEWNGTGSDEGVKMKGGGTAHVYAHLQGGGGEIGIFQPFVGDGNNHRGMVGVAGDVCGGAWQDKFDQ